MTTIQTRAGRVAYRESGSGPTVLLLHATLHDRHDFDPIVETLARRYRTIAVDWPGHGDSDPVDAGMEPSAPLFAGVLEDVVDGLGLARAALIGNSVGGFAAARLAITRPEFVAGLILVNTGGFVPLNPLARTFCRVMSTPAVWRTAPLFVRGYMKAKSDNDREIVERAIARARTDDGVRTATGLWRSFATPEHDLRNRADALSAPTLIVWGKRDMLVPIAFADHVREALPAAEHLVLPGGHVPQLENPKRTHDALSRFLAKG